MTSLRPRHVWTRLAAVALVGAAAACGSAATDAASFGAGGDGTGGNGGAGSADAGTQFSPNPDDAGVGGSAPAGNILCNGTKYTCIPDGDNGVASGCGDTTTGGVSDAGAADYDASTVSCHVVAVADDGGYDLTPSCTSSGSGHNGSSCTSSSDCGSGFECVGQPGMCRKYCCDSDCKDATFCDIQSETADNKVKVPVCEPVKSCTLLQSAQQCSAEETCTVVDESGTTSCVGTGPALVGQSCDTVHCAADLVCLGDLNARKCYQLCHTSANECASGLTCMSSAPLFREADVGVCQ